MNDEPVKTLLTCQADYTLADETGVIAGGSADAIIDDTTVTIKPASGEPVTFSPREIVDFSMGDYKVSLSLTSGEKLLIKGLGYCYEDFARVLSRQRNEVLIKDMLMQEEELKTFPEADYEFTGEKATKGSCEIRLYGTGLVIMPAMGEPSRVHYSDITGIEEGDYGVTISAEGGRVLKLFKMGASFDPFRRILNETINSLSSQAQASLKEAYPVGDSAVIRKAARLMRDGKAARKSDLDKIDKNIWPRLEKMLEKAGIKEEYGYIASLAQKDKMCIGLKKELYGDSGSEYVWLLAPIYSHDRKKTGNAVVLEAVSIAGEEEPEKKPAEIEGSPDDMPPAEEAPPKETPAGSEESKESGKATYVFRIMDSRKYAEISPEELEREVDSFLRTVNDCMLSINFRREPVYLSDDLLQEPKYLKYFYSLRRLPSLKTLRERFMGRAVHSSFASWKKSMSDSLSKCLR